ARHGIPLELRDAGQIHRPGQRRAAPELGRRFEFGATVERADPQAVEGRVGTRIRGVGVERRAAIRAEGFRPPVPARRGPDVYLRRSALQHEAAGQRRYGGAEGGAGQGLAIGAMAHPDFGRVDFRRETDLAARSEEHTSELQSPYDLVCRLLLEKKKKTQYLSRPLMSAA